MPFCSLLTTYLPLPTLFLLPHLLSSSLPSFHTINRRCWPQDMPYSLLLHQILLLILCVFMQGYKQTAGTLTTRARLCNTNLYFNVMDQEGNPNNFCERLLC